MKTPNFWYPNRTRPANWLPLFLSPLSALYRFATALRGRFHTPYVSSVPVICIGNVVAGGAGKTPTALALAALLQASGHKPVFVTRGYKGIKTSGQSVVLVDPAVHSAADVGDEALLLAAVAPTYAGRGRREAICLAESCGSVILMDDGLQNPLIAPSASILVIDGDAGLGNGHTLPAGPLREPLSKVLARVKAVVMIGDNDKDMLAEQIKLPLFKATLVPEMSSSLSTHVRYLAFAGIGRPAKFYKTLRSLGLDLCATQDFPDHHAFTSVDIDMLRLRSEELGARMITTEKDALRLPTAMREEVVILPVVLTFADTSAGKALIKICLS